ncbi:MAG: DUF4440 domain-containing protein [Alphaproteobacteria bacterium]
MARIAKMASIVAVSVLASSVDAAELPKVADPSFAAFLPSFIEGTKRFMEGDATLWKQNAAHSEDAIIMGAWGAYEKGWKEEVSDRYDWAVQRFQDSEADLEIEYLNAMTSGDLAFTTAIEHARVKLAGQNEAKPMTLRATQVFRKENGQWKLILRHADPLIAKIATEAVLTK